MNYKIVIDPGHGGTDPGAVGNGIVEKDLNLKISQYQNKRFNELGIPNSMTRDSDVTLEPSARTDKVKSFYGNGTNVIVLSNHINAGGGDGFEIVYALRNGDTLAAKISEEIAKTGQNVRKYYQKRSSTDPSKDYYFIIRDTANTQANLIEYGFLDSSGDDVSQLKNNWQAMAEAVVKGVTNYISKPYTLPLTESGSLGTYVVQKGDSLWSIANKHGVTVDELKKTNNLTSNLVSIGQTLIIPGKEENTGLGIIYYTVLPGDSLYKIANEYGVTIDELVKTNNLKSTNLSVGQTLIIPKKLDINSEDTGDVVYTVEKGDSLYSIARKYNISVNDIMVANNLKTTNLAVGQKLLIPYQPLETEEIKPIVDEIKYIVKVGDTLYSIAAKNNTTVEALKNANNLSTNNLSVGQTLIIPASNNYNNYTVKSGDSLYKIAQNFNTTVDKIMALNNMKTNMLSIGQQLLIPR